MTTVQSSGGNAYSDALAKLLERMQSANESQSSSTSATTTSTAAKVPSLASVLAADDDDSGNTSTQASSDIAALMLEVQQLKSSSASASSSSAPAGPPPGPPPSAADMFKTADTDGDNSLSVSEFVAARPDGMSEDDAKAMFNAIDSSGTGSITEDQLESYMEKNKPVEGEHHGGHDAAARFAKIDSDGNGSVSLTEFVAGRPKDMSEEDATTLFKSIDTEDTGSIGEEQFAAKLKEQGQAAGTSTGASVDGASADSDAEALAKELMMQLKQIIQTFNNGYVDTSAYAASATSDGATKID